MLWVTKKNKTNKHMDELCISCFQGGNLSFVGGGNTHTNTPTWASRGTQRPGMRVEPQLPIRGHYCQTVEPKLPGAHWLPTYLLLQFNYKFDNMKHCTHSMWQYSTSDNKNWGQLVEEFWKGLFRSYFYTMGGICFHTICSRSQWKWVSSSCFIKSKFTKTSKMNQSDWLLPQQTGPGAIHQTGTL